MHADSLTEEQIRELLRRGVNPAMRRELEVELGWREHDAARLMAQTIQDQRS